MDTLLQAIATRYSRERQMASLLRSLAVEKADHQDAEAIIEKWRAYYGFRMDEQGNISFDPS
jgi:hypothetical protein